MACNTGPVSSLTSTAIWYPAPFAAGRVPRHVYQRTRGLFLHSLHGREFQTLIVAGRFVIVSEVEKVSLHNNVERRETKAFLADLERPNRTRD